MNHSTNSPLWLGLDDPAARQVESAGGKGASLARLLGVEGINVPKGLVLSPNGVKRYFSQDARDSPADLTSLRVAIESLIQRAGIVICRSSAVDEDGTERSYAGQFLSVPCLATVDSVFDAIRDVRAASAGPIPSAYAKKGPSQSVSMAAVVQEMVAADRAGVAFSRNPLNGKRAVIIDASYGLGTLVVEGRSSPDEITVNENGKILDYAIGRKSTMALATMRGVAVLQTPEQLSSQPCLSPAQCEEISRATMACEAEFGRAIDVEWAIKGDQLWIVQARPITPTKLRTGVDHE